MFVVSGVVFDVVVFNLFVVEVGLVEDVVIVVIDG